MIFDDRNKPIGAKTMNKFKTKHSDYTDAQFKETLLGFATLIISFTAFMGFLFYYLG